MGKNGDLGEGEKAIILPHWSSYKDHSFTSWQLRSSSFSRTCSRSEFLWQRGPRCQQPSKTNKLRSITTSAKVDALKAHHKVILVGFSHTIHFRLKSSGNYLMNHFQRLNEVKELKIFFFAQRAKTRKQASSRRPLPCDALAPTVQNRAGARCPDDTSALRTVDTSALRTEDQQLQPVSWNFQHRIFELLSLRWLTAQSGTWRLCGRRPFALSRFTAPTLPVIWWVRGAVVRGASMRSAWMSAEAESSFEHWTALCSRVLKVAWNRLYITARPWLPGLIVGPCPSEESLCCPVCPPPCISSKDPSSSAYWLFASPQLDSVRWCCRGRAKRENI